MCPPTLGRGDYQVILDEDIAGREVLLGPQGCSQGVYTIFRRRRHGRTRELCRPFPRPALPIRPPYLTGEGLVARCLPMGGITRPSPPLQPVRSRLSWSTLVPRNLPPLTVYVTMDLRGSPTLRCRQLRALIIIAPAVSRLTALPPRAPCNRHCVRCLDPIIIAGHIWVNIGLLLKFQTL